MASRLATVLLLTLLLIFQGQLWFGRGSVFHVFELEKKVAQQNKKNEQLKQENQQLMADLQDLKTGLISIEDRARHELGMIKPNEIFVQYAH